MEEIKYRYGYVKTLLSKTELNTDYPKTWLVIESIAIQYRKIIELIAFSTIIANEDIYKSLRPSYAKDWNARLIFQDIERVNPNFYPTPISEFIGKENSDEPIIIAEHIDGFLTKSMAIKLYQKCSAFLHAENRYSKPLNLEEWIKYFKAKHYELNKLLDWHWVVLVPENFRYMVGVNLETNSKVEIYGASIGE